MNVQDQTLPSLLAQLAAWRTISQDDILLSAPMEIQRVHATASRILSNLQEGERDPWLGGTIHCIVRKSTKYIIYLNEDYEVRWWWLVRVNEQVVNSVQARINALEHESAFLLAEPTGKRLSETQQATARNIRALIGEAMAVALNSGTLEDCEKVLVEAERQISIVKDQYARPIFAGWFIALVAALGIVAMIFSYFLKDISWIKSTNHLFTSMWLEAALCGAFGALISAITRTRTLHLEPAAGHRGLFIEALARALIGAGAGLLTFFALHAGIVSDALSPTADHMQGVRLFLSIAAGASERILPSLIGRAEAIVDNSSATNTDKSTKTAKSNSTQLTPDQAVG